MGNFGDVQELQRFKISRAQDALPASCSSARLITRAEYMVLAHCRLRTQLLLPRQAGAGGARSDAAAVSLHEVDRNRGKERSAGCSEMEDCEVGKESRMFQNEMK